MMGADMSAARFILGPCLLAALIVTAAYLYTLL
jgi:hypothetical protein